MGCDFLLLCLIAGLTYNFVISQRGQPLNSGGRRGNKGNGKKGKHRKQRQDCLHRVKLDDLFLLRIFHQSDIHSHFGPIKPTTQVCPKTERSSRTCIGGFARALWFLSQRRKEYSSFDLPMIRRGETDALYLNAGDFFGGDISFSLFGSAMASELVPLMNYTALAVGHAEFSRGAKELHSFMKAVRIGKTVFVCNNFKFDKKLSKEVRGIKKLCTTKLVSTRVLPQLGGLSRQARVVCIVGYTSPQTTKLTPIPGISLIDEVAALNKLGKYIKKRRCKIVIALGHSGYRRDLQIAKQVDYLDIVVGGHSHTLMADGQWQPFEPLPPKGSNDHPHSLYPTVVTQESGHTVLVLHSYKHGKYMGFIDVGFDRHGHVCDYWPDLRLLDNSYEEDPSVMHILHKYDDKIEQALHKVIGQSLVELDGSPEKCNMGECNVGNLLADAALRANEPLTKNGHPVVSVALVTAEIIKMKEPQPPGSITFEFLTKSLPFGHTFSVYRVPGRALREALHHSIVHRGPYNGKFLQVSGLKVVFAGTEVDSITVDLPCEACGEGLRPRPLDDFSLYYVALPEYLTDGSTEYCMFDAHDTKRNVTAMNNYMLDLDVALDYFKFLSPVQAEIEDRITMGKPRHHEEKTNSGVKASVAYPMRIAVMAMLMRMWLIRLRYATSMPHA